MTFEGHRLSRDCTCGADGPGNHSLGCPAQRPFAQAELDTMRCHHGCEEHPIFLSSPCHPGHPVSVAYERTRGLLVLWCFTCRTRFSTIAVAEEAPTDA